MQVTETLSDGLRRSFAVTVPQADIELKRAAKLGVIGKSVRLPGFRPGKVPASIVKQRYGAAVMAEVLEESVNDATQQLLEERGLRPAGQPKIEVKQMPATTDQDLLFDLDVELLPEIAMPDFAALELVRYKAEPTIESVDGALSEIVARQEGRDFETGAELLKLVLIERCRRSSERKYRELMNGPTVAELPEVPFGWHWATMPQLGELNRGKSKHRPRDDSRLYGGPYPFVQTGDVRHAEGVLSRHTQTYSEMGLGQSRLWPAGTLCITIAANIAETARLSYPACFPDSIVGFVCDSGEATTKWVQMFLATAKENIETFAPGTAQKNINLEVLQNVAVPLPPLAEQHRIVAEADRRLSLIRVAEAQVIANLARAQRLRQSILHAAFSA